MNHDEACFMHLILEVVHFGNVIDEGDCFSSMHQEIPDAPENFRNIASIFQASDPIFLNKKKNIYYR